MANARPNDAYAARRGEGSLAIVEANPSRSSAAAVTGGGPVPKAGETYTLGSGQRRGRGA